MKLYVIRNTITGKEYVGMTGRSLKARMANHRSDAFARNEPGPLYEAMRKDGLGAFRMELLAEATSREQLEQFEQDAIRERQALQPNGYNVVMGGRGNLGWVPSKDTRNKIGQARKGQACWNAGKRMSAEYRATSAVAQRKRFQNEQASGFVRKAWNKGIPATSEHRSKQREGHARRRRERELYADFT